MLKKLPAVSLAAIDTVDSNRISRVLSYCSQLFGFADVVLYSDSLPSIPYKHNVRLIRKLNYADVQRWELSELRYAFETPYCITVQHDGWILNPHLWTDDFLKWDFVGAPWPRSWGRMRVGNSGFSLRSQRFCEVTAQIADSYSDEGYDVFVCRARRREMVERGMKFAPVRIAAAFSWEYDCDDVPGGPFSSFGFHGWVNGRDPARYNQRLA